MILRLYSHFSFAVMKSQAVETMVSFITTVRQVLLCGASNTALFLVFAKEALKYRGFMD